ncbi:MAG: hypothetical protein HYV17_07940 [Xanthomonadales bacterium]|nr:hypothetical protein [Xanthomonadales bacterium]
MNDRSYIAAGLLGIAAAVGVWCAYGGLPEPKLLRDVADSLSSVTGTLAGFLLTCISIVVAITPSQVVMQELKRVGAMRRLVMRSGASVIALVTASVIAAIARLADGMALQAFSSLTALLAGFGLVLLVAAGREYLRIFGYLSSTRSGQSS